MRRYVLHVLLLVNVGLAAVLAWLWVTPAGTLRDVHWQPPAARKTDFASMLPALPAVSTPDTGQFVAMLDRPLFSITRRPPPPPPPPAPEPPVDTLSTARLFGVFQGEGIGGVIMKIGGKDRRVRLNEAVDGWTLRSIEGRNVTFASGGQTRVLQLSRAALTTYTGLARQQPVAPTVPGARSAPSAPPAAGTSPRAVFGGTAR